MVSLLRRRKEYEDLFAPVLLVRMKASFVAAPFFPPRPRKLGATGRHPVDASALRMSDTARATSFSFGIAPYLSLVVLITSPAAAKEIGLPTRTPFWGPSFLSAAVSMNSRRRD